MLIGTAAALAASSVAPATGASASIRAAGPLQAAPNAVTPAAIRAEQDAIVTQEHEPAITAANFAVAEFQISVSNDQQALSLGGSGRRRRPGGRLRGRIPADCSHGRRGGRRQPRPGGQEPGH